MQGHVLLLRENSLVIVCVSFHWRENIKAYYEVAKLLFNTCVLRFTGKNTLRYVGWNCLEIYAETFSFS